MGRLTVPNDADGGANDGIPAQKGIFNSAFWPFNANGVISRAVAPVPPYLVRNSDGSALQFGQDGSVILYDEGTYQNIPFTEGGDGFAYRNLVGLRTGVERFTTNVLGHYDLTDRITLSTELLYARTKGAEIP